MRYFQNLPIDFYKFYGNSLDVVTNITTRVEFNEKIKTNAASYYEYVVMDGDTPEILASKFYDSSERHWIILLLNNIVDPVTQWPLSEESLNLYIEKRYEREANGSPVLNWSKTTVKNYEKIETRTNVVTKEKFSETLTVDQTTYNSIVPSTELITLESGNVIELRVEKRAITYYDYELYENESKRNIKLLKPEFVEFVEREFKESFI